MIRFEMQAGAYLFRSQAIAIVANHGSRFLQAIKRLARIGIRLLWNDIYGRVGLDAGSKAICALGVARPDRSGLVDGDFSDATRDSKGAIASAP
mgnify:CR=1 FL=1